MAVYLKLGLKVSKCFSKSNASSEALGNIEVKVFFLGIFVLEMIFAAKGESID